MESVDEIPAEVAEEAGKVANGNPPKDHPEIEHSLSKEEWEHYQAIKEANLEVSEAQMAYDIANGKAKEAKKHLESVSLELSNLIAAGPTRPNPQRELPFEGGGTADQRETHHDTDEIQNKIEWQRTPITDILTLTKKQHEKLDEIGVYTIGQFEHVRGGKHRDYPDGLRSIPGVGEKTVDKWEDDVVNWLAKNAREPEGQMSPGIGETQ